MFCPHAIGWKTDSIIRFSGGKVKSKAAQLHVTSQLGKSPPNTSDNKHTIRPGIVDPICMEALGCNLSFHIDPVAKTEFASEVRSGGCRRLPLGTASERRFVELEVFRKSAAINNLFFSVKCNNLKTVVNKATLPFFS